MEQNKNNVRLSRFISLVLRHKPSTVEITLDANGWADVRQMLAGINRTGKMLDMETLECIVREDNKKRYSFNENHSKIRANQGHSIPVDLKLEVRTPPDVLYHGTAKRFVESIMREGLLPRKRQYVHLSTDTETAKAVGSRHGSPVILEIDAAAMAKDGFAFFLTENELWLCSEIPRQYLKIIWFEPKQNRSRR